MILLTSESTEARTSCDETMTSNGFRIWKMIGVDVTSCNESLAGSRSLVTDNLNMEKSI